MIKFLIALFLLGLSWNGIVAPPPAPNMALFMVLILLATVVLVAGLQAVMGKSLIIRMNLPVMLACMLLPVCALVSYLVNLSNFSFGRVLLYSMPLIIYVAITFLISATSISLEWMLKVLSVGFFVTMFVVSVEFIGRFIFSFEIFQFVPRVRGDLIATVGIGNDTILRPTGLSTESTVVAFYINCVSPIAIYMLVVSKSWIVTKVVGLLVILTAALATFSPAVLAVVFAFLCLSLVSFIGSIMRSQGRGFLIKRKALFSGLLVILVFGLVYLFVPHEFFQRSSNALLNYIMGFETGVSARAIRAQEALSIFLSDTDVYQIIFGHGTGFFSEVSVFTLGSSPNNAYLVVLLELGVLGLLVFLAIVLMPMFLLWRSKSEYALPVFIGVLAGSMHLMVVAIFFHPFYLVLVPLGIILSIHDTSAQATHKTISA